MDTRYSDIRQPNGKEFAKICSAMTSLFATTGELSQFVTEKLGKEVHDEINWASFAQASFSLTGYCERRGTVGKLLEQLALVIAPTGNEVATLIAELVQSGCLKDKRQA